MRKLLLIISLSIITALVIDQINLVEDILTFLNSEKDMSLENGFYMLIGAIWTLFLIFIIKLFRMFFNRG